MRVFKVFFALSSLLLFVSGASAQTPPQQYIYSSEVLNTASSPSVVSGFSKASQTGALGVIPGSPFSERFEGGLVAIDGQGKFLFVLNPTSNEISMFQIDPTSGALSEVPGSPFQVPPTINPNLAPSHPISIATERSGKFVFVGYYLGDIQGLSSVVSLAIDTSGPNPVLTTQQSTPISGGGKPLQLFTDPKGLRLYVGLQFGQNGLQAGGAQVYSIDSSTGALAYLGVADTPPGDGQSDAMDAQGRFLFAGYGRNIGVIDSNILSPVDGTSTSPSSSLELGFGNLPLMMVAENSGKFLYVTQGAGTAVYSIDQSTGALTSLLAPISTITFYPGSVVADPMGPYIYALVPGSGIGIHVYQIGQQTGNLSEIPGSPFTSGLSGVVTTPTLAISGNPVQAVSGPVATIFPSTGYSGGTVAVGSSAPTGAFSLVNTGGQTLIINSISIVGTNPSSFSQSSTCTTSLAPNMNCSINITFMPVTAGALSATLQVADNAAGSPQTLALTGTGTVPAPAITFSPATPSFPTITEGTTGTAQTLTVLSTGTAPLHLSSVSVAGPNPLDFSFTNNCTLPVAPSSSCAILLVFSPLAPGQRNANLMIADDAANSLQTISLSAVATPAFTPGPAPNGSITASISAGQTAQFQLQLTPGTGFSGTVSLACSGAPPNSTCQVPATVTIANGVPAPFTVAVATAGTAFLPPALPWRFLPPARIRVLLPTAFALALLIFAWNHEISGGWLRAKPLAWSASLTAILLCSMIYAAGCGSAAVTTTPPPLITPSGSSAIIITLSAMSPTQQPLQLPPIQLTLTVK